MIPARLFGSLYRKLSAVLLVLVLLVAACVLVINAVTTRLYVDEVEQRLHHDLAAHLVAEQPLLVGGRVDEQGLKQVFHTLMVINPRIECYLLDRDGRILAFDAPEGHVQTDRVDLEPIRRVLAGASPPTVGDDPRDPEHRKIFSVATITGDTGDTGEPEGFLYVVLAGEQYASIAARLGASHILRLSLWTLAGSVLLAALLGLISFRLLTRRLRDLQRRMHAFERSGFAAISRPVLPASTFADEIDGLGDSFGRMSERIVEQVDGLRRVDQLRRELLTNVSHDLRTPVSSLQGYLETLLLKEGTLTDEERGDYLATALAQSQRLGCLVGELFELARLDSGDVTLELEKFPLAELVQDVAQSFALRAAERHVSLQTELRASSFQVLGDLRLIERTLENLLENALRYTPRGGAITVAVSDHSDHARVTVSDNGCGIPADEIPRIFERFYRGSYSPDADADPENEGRSEPHGTGLGLAIAQRVIELHRSQIEVHSRLGAGTTFAFDLASAS